MNELKEFIYGSNSKVRVVQENGVPWFVGKDVTNILGYTNSSKALKDHVDNEDKLNNESLSSLGQRGGWIVNESGVYSLVFASKLPEAKKFKHWVTAEVLPTIRKTGGYVNNEDQFISTYLSNADEQTKIMFKMTLQTVNNLNEKIEKDKPKVAFAEAVAYAEGNIKVGDVARIITQAGYKINQNDFYVYLRDHNYLQKTERSKNLPTHFSIVNNLIKIEEHVYTRNGKKHIRLQSVITPKGQRYFVARLVYGAPVNVEI